VFDQKDFTFSKENKMYSQKTFGAKK